jgi:uncharacterized protein (TIGR02145 family)
METININGLIWDVENLELSGGVYFTQQEALEAAQAVGKRLPTREEFEALALLGSTWDSELRGRWFGEDSNLKGKSKKSVFFPASGFRSGVDDALYDVGNFGSYWSSSVSGASLAYYLGFYSSDVGPAYNVGRAWGQSVRCVRSINQIIDRHE